MIDWPLAPDAGEGKVWSPPEWLVTLGDFAGISAFAGVVLTYAWVFA